MDPARIAATAFWDDPAPEVMAVPGVEPPPLELLQPGQVAFATSGTTGDPGWLVLTKDALLASARAVNEHLGVDRTSVWGLALPIHHVGGFGVAARAHAAGCRFSVFPSRWDASSFVRWIGESRITHTSLVPTQVHDIVNAGQRAPDGLVAVVVGGGRLDQSPGQAARDLGWPVLASYGMTESASQIATQSLGACDAPYAPSPLPPLPIWTVALDEDGCLMVKGPALFSATLRRTPAGWTHEPRTGDWFTTRDLARIDPNGALEVLGRADARVKVLGELIDPSAIEAAMAAHSPTLFPGSFAVAAVPDERAGHRLVGVFRRDVDEGIAADALARHHAKCSGPERVGGPIFVDAIPMSALGKIRRQALAALAAGLTT